MIKEHLTIGDFPNPLPEIGHILNELPGIAQVGVGVVVGLSILWGAAALFALVENARGGYKELGNFGFRKRRR